MGIIDELAEETGYHPAKKEEGKAFRPSSYNPLYSFPENLGHNLRGAGSEIMKGAGQLGEGNYLSGAFHTGLGALEGIYSPLEAGVQTATQPLSDATGVPDWLLTGAAMLPLGYKSLAGGARRLMGIGGEAASEAAPAVEAASSFDVGKMRSDYKPPPTMDTRAMSGEYNPASVARAGERFFPETKLLPQFGKGEPVYHMPNETEVSKQPMRESYAEGYRPGEPQRQIEYKPTPAPAIPMPDYTAEKFMGMAAKRSGEMKAERGAFREAIPKMDYGTRPAKRIERPTSVAPSIEELSKEAKLAKLSELSSERRFFPEQASTEDLRGMTGRAAGRASEMKAERDASRIPNTPAPRTRQIRRPEEEMPPSLGKEEKLSKLESESMRSIDDAVRTLNAGGMSATDAQKHILNNIRAGRMTAVRPNGAPLTKQEAKLIRSLKGLGGVSWIRG
jgi:hypothetical protein